MSYYATRIRNTWRGIAEMPAGEPVPSPCTNVCRMDQATGLCFGCLRNIDEVIAWSKLDDAGKREVWQRLAVRAGAKEQA